MKKRPYILISLLVIAGLGILFYPTISSIYNAKYQAAAIVSYEENLSRMSAEQLQNERELAQAYNAALTGTGITDPFIPGSGVALPENYTSILDMQDGIMGYVSIPIIGVALPIYHGTSDAVLEKGVGHMERSAFPIGGEGTHAVLTGHTGLPNTKLFTDLKELAVGENFYIQILEETLAYEIDQILVVDPTDTQALRPVPGMDYVTLVTCTPYAINSHRLLVRGVRVPYEAEQFLNAGNGNKTQGIFTYDFVIAIVVTLAVALVFSVLFINRKRSKPRHSRRPQIKKKKYQ